MSAEPDVIKNQRLTISEKLSIYLPYEAIACEDRDLHWIVVKSQVKFKKGTIKIIKIIKL